MRALPCIAFLAAIAPATGRGDESAVDIARKARDQGSFNLVDARADLSMITTDKSGNRRERRLVASAKRIDGRLHALLRFKAPPDIAGVALLAVEGQGGAPDDIALYTPKIKRTRRIAASQRGQSFMDSDFAYADFSGAGSVSDKDVARQGDDKVDGADCYVLSGPGSSGSPYKTVKVWVDKASSVVRRAELSGADGVMVKRFIATRVGPLGGRTLAIESTMESPAAGSKTTVIVHSLEAGALPDDAFTERGLERG